MSRVLCFGELLLRINLDADGAWINRQQLPFFVGGAELNVATALSGWGISAGYVSCLPENHLGESLAGAVTQRGVNIDGMLYAGDKVGLYYLRSGSDLKSGSVIYDRQASSFSQLRTGMLDWGKLFQEVDCFHFSAICPALSQELAAVCEEALFEADKRGIRVSIDLNYRKSLWGYTVSPPEVMQRLLRHCTIVMGNIWAAEALLDIKPITPLKQDASSSEYARAAKEVSEQIMVHFPKCELVANTFRFTQAAEISYFSCLYSQGELFTSGRYRAGNIVDAVGSGDCYMAALLYGILQNFDSQEIVDFASAAAFSKLFVKGDSTGLSIAEIQEMVRPFLQ